MEARIERLVEEGFKRSGGGFASRDCRPACPSKQIRVAAMSRGRLGLDKHVLDPVLRTAEFGNWLSAKCLAAPRRLGCPAA